MAVRSGARSRKPATERRREIADAVLRVIGGQGLGALTAENVARAVGLTSGALFRHFATMDEILAAAVERGAEAARATIPDRAAPPLERLMAIARARVELFGARPGIAWLLLSDQVHLAVPAPARAPLTELVRDTRRFLLAALREGARDGTIRSDIDPEVLLVLFTGAVHASVGPAGIHKAAARTRRASSARVLEALRVLLAPPTPGHPTQPEENR